MKHEHEEESLLSALLDGELEGPERVRLQKHLALCPDCVFELESLRKVKTILAKAPQKSLPAGWTASAPKTLVAERAPSRFFPQNIFVPALVAAAVSLAISFWFFQSQNAFPIRHSLSLNSTLNVKDLSNSSPSSIVIAPFDNSANQTQNDTP